MEHPDKKADSQVLRMERTGVGLCCIVYIAVLVQCLPLDLQEGINKKHNSRILSWYSKEFEVPLGVKVEMEVPNKEGQVPNRSAKQYPAHVEKKVPVTVKGQYSVPVQGYEEKVKQTNENEDKLEYFDLEKFLADFEQKVSSDAEEKKVAEHFQDFTQLPKESLNFYDGNSDLSLNEKQPNFGQDVSNIEDPWGPFWMWTQKHFVEESDNKASKPFPFANEYSQCVGYKPEESNAGIIQQKEKPESGKNMSFQSSPKFKYLQYDPKHWASDFYTPSNKKGSETYKIEYISNGEPETKVLKKAAPVKEEPPNEHPWIQHFAYPVFFNLSQAILAKNSFFGNKTQPKYGHSIPKPKDKRPELMQIPSEKTRAEQFLKIIQNDGVGIENVFSDNVMNWLNAVKPPKTQDLTGTYRTDVRSHSSKIQSRAPIDVPKKGYAFSGNLNLPVFEYGFKADSKLKSSPQNNQEDIGLNEDGSIYVITHLVPPKYIPYEANPWSVAWDKAVPDFSFKQAKEKQSTRYGSNKPESISWFSHKRYEGAPSKVKAGRPATSQSS